MLKRGSLPYLECSSKGDKRLSAFHARVRGDTIENIYQAAKVFEDGSTNLHWRAAKGRKPVNVKEVARLYDQLWWEYLNENPELWQVIAEASGLSDQFGQEGHQCQADTLWRAREWYLNQRRS